MKRKLAAFLAVCMLLHSPLSMLNVYGSTWRELPFIRTEQKSGAESRKGASPANSLARQEATPSEASEKEEEGILRIDIRNFLGADNCMFRLLLEPDASTARKQEVLGDLEETFETNWESGQGSQGMASVFEMGQIPAGSYGMTLECFDGEAGAYLPYSQEVKIKSGSVTSVSLANDYPEYYGYQEEAIASKRKFGVLAAGNFVTGDQEKEVLDEADLDMLLENLYGEEDFDTNCDLNGDGQVNLNDLEVFSKFYENKDRRKAKEIYIRLIPEDMVIPLDLGDGSSADEQDVKKLFSNISGDRSQVVLAATPPDDTDGAVIGEANPVTIAAEFEESITMRGLAIVPQTGSPNAIEDGEVSFFDNSGSTEYTVTIKDGKQVGKPKKQSVRTYSAGMVSDSQKEASRSQAEPALQASGRNARALADSVGEDSKDRDEAVQGRTVLIDLGGQIPVKRVVIRITKTVRSTNLAEISSVEFLNNMEDHIPEPDLSIPDKLIGEGGDARFTVSWRRKANVTGYDVYVKGETDKSGIQEQVFRGIEDNTLLVTRLNGAEISNNKAFTVKVRSVNGSWQSKYSEPITVMTEAARRPEPPEQIQITGGYQKLKVSWKKMKSTDDYTLYYREKNGGEGAFSSISGITGTSTEVTGLKDGTAYEIYMTGRNQIGVSDPSERYTGTTVILEPPVTPDFLLINVPREGGGAPEHILSVDNHVNGTNLCEEEFAPVDGRYETSWVRLDWDAGCTYENPNNANAPLVTFDEPYEMDTVVIVPDYEQSYAYTRGRLFYWEEIGGTKKEAPGTLARKQDERGKIYYEFEAREKFTAKQVQMTVSTVNQRRISYAELKFYRYYDLKERIYSLYADNLHMTLKPEVTLEQINGFYDELEYVDPVSGEKTPQYEYLKLEIDQAKAIYEKGVSDADIIPVNNRLVQSRDSHTGFAGGLNTWQPLGVTGLAGDKVMIYVGGNQKKLGEPASLTVIASQYHGESSNVFAAAGTLKIGPNEITIPKITSLSSAEAGGQLYLRYDGAYEGETYAVRVEIMEPEEGKSGAAKIPVLDLSAVTDENERAERIKAYLAQLESYDAQAMHEKYHPNEENGYQETNCIFGATDLAGEKAMYSLPAKKVLEGIKASAAANGKPEQQAVESTLAAMDEMLTLFYQHKGLSDDPDAGEKNRMPVSRINIRYQRMFEGAFMYAGGAHIGIGWGSASGMMAGVPLAFNSEGGLEEGNYFGWGISHEIGHEINEGAYAVAEVTNNYYAQLAKSAIPGAGVRWNYPDVYRKVTSGAKGPSSSGAVQLAMYWQLHLSHDEGAHHQIYDSYEEQFRNLFFARVDSYARDPSKAPKPGGTGLTLGGNSDNNLMRLSCAAAQKNILEFFERWGMEPDETTKAYAGQFEKETRALWLASDDQRSQALSRRQPDESQASSIRIGGNVVYSPDAGGPKNEVTIHLNLESGSAEDLLGYEVFRCEWKGDTYVRRPTGFVPAEEASYTDIIMTANNRAFTYEVTGYDIWLRPTETVTLQPSVQVSHNGNLDSRKWTAATNMNTVTADGDPDEEPSEENPDAVEKIAIGCIIDGDGTTTYTGKTSGGLVPEIILYLNGEEVITGLEYYLSGGQAPIGSFEIYVSRDGVSWEKAETEEDVFTLEDSGNGRYQQIIFSSPAKEGQGRQLRSYEASMVKLTAPGQAGEELSLSELVLLGETGDKVELTEDGIGILESDYQNPSDPSQVLIPANSLVFTGIYAGNPAYNTLILWDEDGNILGGTDGEELVAEQLIFAEDPGSGNLRDISDGRWVYFIRPEYIPKVLPGRVRAELYRVDDAQAQTGQRLVSSTVFTDIPEELPAVKLQETAGIQEGQDEEGPALPAGGNGREDKE